MIRVVAEGRESEIVVRPGGAGAVGAMLRERSKAPKAMVVTDSTVGPLHAQAVVRSLEAAGFTVVTHTLPAGEPNKKLETLLPAYGTFLAAEIDRGTPLVAVGGGVTGDMAGLLAATLLRGVPLVQVPTTLMAMVDSAIGGKTAVNHAAGKNLIGAFHQPILVLSDVRLLGTLPDAELRYGLAECVKHDAIRDPAHFARLGEVLPRVLARDEAALATLVHHNAAIKAAVVTEDPLERGVRAHLNLGHTFAHGIELTTDHAVAHGAAVGLGLCCAAFLSHRLGMLPAGDRDALIRAVELTGLATRPATKLDEDAMLAAMRKDKKVEHGRLRFVLLEAIGKPVVRGDVEERDVRETLRWLEGR